MSSQTDRGPGRAPWGMRSLRGRLTLAFGVLVAALAGVGLVSYRQLDRVLDEQGWVIHTHEVIARANGLGRLCEELESGLGGFLLVGDEASLSRFQESRQHFSRTLEELGTKVSDNPEQVARLERLGKQMHLWEDQVALPRIRLQREAGLDMLQRTAAPGGLGGPVREELEQLLETMEARLGEAFPRGRLEVLSLSRALARQVSGARGFLLTGAPAERAAYQRGVEAFLRALDALRRLPGEAHLDGGEGTTTSPRPGSFDSLRPEDLARIERLFDSWTRSQLEPALEARGQQDKRQQAIGSLREDFLSGRGRRAMRVLEEMIQVFIATEEGLLAERIQQARLAQQRPQQALAVGTLVALCLGIVLATWLTRTLLAELGGDPETLVAMTRRLAEGELDEDLWEETRRATGLLAAIRSLRSLVDSLQEARRAEGLQAWVKTGVASLHDAMRGEFDEETLATRGVEALCKHLEAGVGALFLRSPEEELYSLRGSYAYTHRKQISEGFRSGEGLAGQAIREGQQILVRELPEDHVRVASGLGESRPRALVLTPLRGDSEGEGFLGVLEVGFLAEPRELDLEFLREAAAALAGRLRECRSQALVERSLQASQTLSEELQVQQEELQSANEELRVTNEELEEKNQLIQQRSRDVEAAREEVEAKAEELARASQYKSEFLANMSHELRTPLNSLLLLARGLAENAEGNLTPEQVQFAEVIEGSGQDLLSLINEILDLSKIEAGQMEIHPETVEIATLSGRLEQSFRHMAENRELDFEVLVEPETPEQLVTDSQRLEQVLRNLISNAIKFTERGGVTIRFSGADPTAASARPGDFLAIEVIDTGIGIAPEDQALVFEAFRQVDGGSSRRFGGTGLGLSISRELLGLLGGRLELESQPGQGSIFRMVLPREAPDLSGRESPRGSSLSILPPRVGPPESRGASAPPPRPPGRPLGSGSRPELAPLRPLPPLPPEESRGSILVIEDDVRFAGLLRDVCRENGLDCHVAATGEEGLELARGQVPDGLVLDLRLPGVDGWTVLRRLKENPSLRHVPVHILSGEEASLEALRRGALGQLTKPVSRDQIRDVLEDMLRISTSGERSVLVVSSDPQAGARLEALLDDGRLRIETAPLELGSLEVSGCQGFDCLVLEFDPETPEAGDFLDFLRSDRSRSLPPVVVHAEGEISEEFRTHLEAAEKELPLRRAGSEEDLLEEVTLFLHQLVGELPDRSQEILAERLDGGAEFAGRTLLVVDDDMRTTFALSRLLSARGARTLKAEDGQRALELLEEEPEVDLVLMDVMMPGMDGLETMRRLRAQPRYRKLPILALTAKAMPGDRQRCLEAGASDYLSKPIDQDRLLSMIRVWLAR